jgi:hypothetical protein
VRGTRSTDNRPAQLTTAQSVVFYGSSFVRELYVEMVRLQRGLPYSYGVNGKTGNNYHDIPDEVHLVGAGASTCPGPGWMIGCAP